MSLDYHIPVLMKESIDALEVADGIYVDVTFGGGGYSNEIISRLNGGKLYSFDQDGDAEKNAELIESDGFQFIRGNFRFIKKFLRLHGIKTVDGIVGDFGVSSHQFDEADRGFSFRLGGDLDMRMDNEAETKASSILMDYPFEELHRIFGVYGEVKNARNLSNRVIQLRGNGELESIEDFIAGIKTLMPRGKENKYLAQVFQALRIEVNDEMGALQDFLLQTPGLLNEGGRLVLVSYHSLEDRLVKRFFSKGSFSNKDAEKDLYGNEIKPFDVVTRKAIQPTQEEINYNSRARSARLRVAKRNGVQWDKM